MNDNDNDGLEVFLETLMTGDLGKSIENQEKRGQAALVRSQNLPRQCPRAELEALGVVFIEAQLPEGWKIERTDHSMWSNLVDAKGRARGGIFYKAAFYDRSAHMSLNRRYCYGTAPITGWGDDYESGVTPFWGFVSDCGKVIWHTEEMVAARDYDGKDRVEKLAKAQIEAMRPDYMNPLAYWDEE